MEVLTNDIKPSIAHFMAYVHGSVNEMSKVRVHAQKKIINKQINRKRHREKYTDKHPEREAEEPTSRQTDKQTNS